MEKLLLRPSEVQSALGFGRSKTYELLASGQIPVVWVGKSIRVPADGLRDWVRERTINGQPQVRRDDRAGTPAGAA